MTEVYFLLKDASRTSSLPSMQSGFYVVGLVENNRFLPVSGVLGNDDFKDDGRKGWLELGRGKFYLEQSGQAKLSPYIDGYLTKEGFFPSSREIK